MDRQYAPAYALNLVGDREREKARCNQCGHQTRAAHMASVVGELARICDPQPIVR